ncbi:hypothetical protein AJ79_08266 [Helicocarpus griseus UAMH5409]|uniref:Vacuolar membrane PQ loop repeat protein n=1 Tax=Helicocarpus griseus UAMH5409 TaxID=1447875 RepID=A0A2B7WUS3_9EURO|nr:hypothetical protein AJ79_08266 [Helicocarpus griseus UAMH5409]
MSEAIDSIPLTPREAASGVLGSISLACWIFLLVPQLIENYKQSSADAVSLAFLSVWFLGDIANLLGSLWARLVPVIIAIAVYFCLADGILISQCIYYNIKNARLDAASKRRRTLSGRTISDNHHHHRDGDDDGDDDLPDATTPLLSRRMSENLGISAASASAERRRRRSSESLLRQQQHPQHHSHQVEDSLSKILEETEPASVWVKNALCVVGICAAGAAGWAIAWQTGVWRPTRDEGGDEQVVAVGAQVLGYASAVLYLGARIPQIIKNYREKSCEGLSLLFFIFSLLGNLSYGAGILFHSTEKVYFLKNLPWLIGSLGTMFEDALIFVQFRIYDVQNRASSSAVL